jgi:reactive chlorine resistance protein C
MATTIKMFPSTDNVFERAGKLLIRYGLVTVLLWIGAMKFTAYEAKGIEALVATSPLMSWLYRVLSLPGVSNLLGVTEITTGLLIALRPWAPRASAIGSLLAIPTFAVTLTFLFSLPGWEDSLGGFPALSGSGGFLLKDLVLLGASVWTLGDSISAGWTKTLGDGNR